MKTKDKLAELMETADRIAHMRMTWDCSDKVDDVLWAAQAYVNRTIEVIRKEEEEQHE